MFAYFWEDRVYPFDLFFGSRLLHLLFGSISGSFFFGIHPLESAWFWGKHCVLLLLFSSSCCFENLGIIVLRMF